MDIKYTEIPERAKAFAAFALSGIMLIP
jgi:hypothetical protein